MSPAPPGDTGLSDEPGDRSVLLTVRVQPGARRTRLVGSHAGNLKLAVAAAPEKGRANEAAAQLLARLFGLKPSAVEHVRGQTSRSKTFRLGLSRRAAEARIAELLAREERP